MKYLESKGKVLRGSPEKDAARNQNLPRSLIREVEPSKKVDDIANARL